MLCYVMLCYVKLLTVSWVRDKKKLHIAEQSKGMCKCVLEVCQQTNILKLPYLPHHQIRQKPCRADSARLRPTSWEEAALQAGPKFQNRKAGRYVDV